MKCFTVTEKDVWNGIFHSMKPFPHIPVGSFGRNCKVDRFPISKDLFETLSVARNVPDLLAGKGIHRASIIRTAKRKMLILVPESRRDHERALVHLRIRGGYKGSTIIKPADTVLQVAEGLSREGWGREQSHFREMLVEMPPNSFIQVQRTGGAASDRILIWDGDKLSLLVTTPLGGVQALQASC